MRWLVGWNGASAASDLGLRQLRPLGGHLLWPGPDPLWAVGDWRPEEIRTVSVFRRHHPRPAEQVRTGFPDLSQDPDDPALADGAVARLAIVGHCGAGDAALRTALLAASGGALRHLTAWPGSYTVVVQQGSRTTLLCDLAGVRPVFHTRWCGGTAYATAALPLADLVGAPPDPYYLAARLAVPETPEALDDASPFTGVRRVAPGHALSIRAGRPQQESYEAKRNTVGGSSEITEAAATGEVTRSLLEAVRCRVRTGDSPYGASAEVTTGRRLDRGHPDGAHPDGGNADGSGPDPGLPDFGRYGSGGISTRSTNGSGSVNGSRSTNGSRGVSGSGNSRGANGIGSYGTGAGGGRDADGHGYGAANGGAAAVRLRRISSDLSGGIASTVLTLLAAEIPVRPATTAGASGVATAAPAASAAPAPPTPRTLEERWGDPRSYRTLHHGPPSPFPDGTPARTGAVRGSWARPVAQPAQPGTALLAVTFTDTPAANPQPPDPARTAELVRARALAASHARLDHLLVAGGPESLPYADLLDPDLAGPLTDEPGPALVVGLRQRHRLADAGADHLSGHGGRQVLDGHPARLADVLMEHRRIPLLRPVAALARADGSERPVHGTFGTPVAVLRAARRLARTSYAEGLEDAAAQLMARRDRTPASAGAASVQSLAWCAPGPAARWLSDDALSAVAVRLRVAARRAPGEERPGERRARLALYRAAAEFRVLTHVVEETYGQRLHAPYLDNQVIRACRLVPASARVQPGSRPAILGTVLAGAGVTDLPEGWGAGSPPEPQASAESIRAGLRQSIDALDKLFAAPLLADLGLLDADGFRSALHAAIRNVPVPLDGIAEVVSTELWLRRLQARQGSCWTGVPLSERRAIDGGEPVGVP
ncbi:hypothetical protein [Streptacidiphilus sp. EB129]|uniref:hypothetical protein n=1 Tax=Streptacidiphilus sp. EB129 TaxID=3156262 RepID=UPI003516574C